MSDRLFPISLLQICFRQSLSHKLRAALLIFGIAMGVAGVVAIDIAKTSVSKSFDLSFAAITSKATHQITGSRFSIPQSIFTDLRKGLGIYQSAPVITTHVRVKEMDDKVLTLTGIDPFSETQFRQFTIQAREDDEGTGDFSGFITGKAGVFISKKDGRDYDIGPGDRLTFLFGKRAITVDVAGFLDSEDASMNRIFDGMIVTDISHAQEILLMGDRISRIDLILEDETQVDQIKAILPPEALIVETNRQNQVIRQMSGAFETSLTAFSMLALFMGIFLIYNTVSFSVAQRRHLNGTLRALGASRKDIFNAVMIEVMIFALAGSLLGLMIGIALGNGAVRVVCSTVSDIYFVLTVSQTHIKGITLLKGFSAGMAASFAAGFFPARIASMARPVTLMQKSAPETRMKKILPLITGCGLVLTLVTAYSLIGFNVHPGLDFLAVFLIFFGYSLLAPQFILFSIGLFSKAGGRKLGVLFQMAMGNITRALSRTSVLIASLMVVTSVYIGVDLMTHSFRMSIVEWVDGNIGGDIHVESVDDLNRSLDMNLLYQVEALDEVDAVSAYNIHRFFSKTSGEVHIFSYIKDLSEKDWTWMAVEPDMLDEKLDTGWIFVSEIFAQKNRVRLEPGARVKLQTLEGPVEFNVAGVFRDFFMGGGRVIVSRQAMARYFGYTDITAMQIFLKPDQAVPPVMEKITDLSGTAPHTMLEIRSGRAIKQSILSVFDKTFVITQALQLLTAIVALTGILNSVMALILERTRELGVLRACGGQRGQLRQLLLTECGLAGFLSGVMALPLGGFLAYILIHIVNQRSFGWTYDMAIPPALFFQAILLSFGAAVVAGVFPAARAGKINISRALRME